MPCFHCRREILADGAMGSDGRAVHRHCVPADAAEVSAILTKLHITATSGVAPSPTPTPPPRLRVVAGTAPAPRVRGDRDHQADAIAAQIAAKVSKVATGARMSDWSRRFDDLVAEIEGHAARDDVAVLRRLAKHFGTVGARLAGAA